MQYLMNKLFLGFNRHKKPVFISNQSTTMAVINYEKLRPVKGVALAVGFSAAFWTGIIYAISR